MTHYSLERRESVVRKMLNEGISMSALARVHGELPIMPPPACETARDTVISRRTARVVQERVICQC